MDITASLFFVTAMVMLPLGCLSMGLTLWLVWRWCVELTHDG
jgi:hypothetical protein